MVAQVIATHGLSQRRACGLIEITRRSFRRPPRSDRNQRRYLCPILRKSPALGHHTDHMTIDHVTNEPRRPAGGDKRTPQAKVDIARREQQIVALRLRGVSFFEIGRVLGISRQSAHRAFHKALRRGTDEDIQTQHRGELGKLEMEEANVWRAMDANKENWQAQMAGTAQLRGIHIRRAKLLGLDAPTKLDVRGLYRSGTDEMSAESLENQRVWQALPVEEQIRIYEALTDAKKRVTAAIDTTATVTSGSDNRNGVEPPADDAENSET
jgi:hypothetical protein